MPLFSYFAKNTMLDGLGVAVLSLHSGYDGTNPTNEIAGGTPAYARLPIVFLPATGGTKFMSGAYAFDVPAATVAWIGMWTAASANFLGMVPNGGGQVAPFTVDDPATNTITCSGHSYQVNDTLVVWSRTGAGLPSGLAEGTIYYVVFATLSTSLQISATLGGPVLTFPNGAGYLQRITPVTYGGQSQFPLNAFILDATVAA